MIIWWWRKQWQRRSLDTESAATLVHALVTSRVDYCTTVLASTPKSTADRLQRVLNAAARVVSKTREFDDGLSQLLYTWPTSLAWHTTADPLQAVYNCSLMSPAQGFVIFGRPLQATVRQHLWSANSHQLYVQRYRRTMFGRRAFSVAGPTAWNTLPDNLRDPALPPVPHAFRAGLKTLLLSSY